MNLLKALDTSNPLIPDNYLPNLAEYSLYMFFLLLPFTYACQVLSGTPLIAMATYSFLIFSLVAFFKSGFQQDRLAALRSSITQFLPLGFAFLLIHHLISVLSTSVSEYAQLGIRGLMLFTVPLMLFWIAYFLKPDRLKILLILIALGGGLIAGEMLYENISIHIFQRPTEFQLLNRLYVMSRNNGQELTQLFGINYRPPGLLEHVHAVTTFAAIAALAHLVLFCLEGRWYWLLGMTFCAVALVMHGTRLPVVASMLTVIFLGALFIRREKNSRIKRRGLMSIGVLACVLAIQLLVDPLGTASAYYFPAFSHSDFQVAGGRSTFQMIKEESFQLTVNSEWGRLLLRQPTDIFYSLFGYGIVGSLRGQGFNDDLFVFTLLSQYGLIGGAVFFSILAVSISMGAISLWRSDKASDLERALLYFSTGVLIILGFSLLHSSVLQRKAIYPFFPLSSGIISYYCYMARHQKF